ncbi:hypothetical protein K8T06_11345, partial [bacterium]|nr:hypothetical protein [bacterium]
MSFPTEQDGYEQIQDEPEIDYRRYLFVLLAHYRVIIIFVVISALLAGLKLNVREDTYTSYAQVVIEKETSAIGATPYYYRR